MIDIDKRINVLIKLGVRMSEFASESDGDNTPFKQANLENPWFTISNIRMAFQNWGKALSAGKVNEWIAPNIKDLNMGGMKRVGVINAGNIPLVGLHDMLSVMVSGHSYVGKNASNDSILLPFIVKIIEEIEPGLVNNLNFVQRIENIDAIIATGSNNSARYFGYYFGKYPNIIRRNRNGVGVINGSESDSELALLGNDIFSYFGLGCRNVSKIYVPENYEMRKFFEGVESLNEIMQHNKYMNNFDYNNSILMLKKIKFLQNGFLIVRKENQISSPVSVLHYEEYDSVANLEKDLLSNIDEIQCIASAGKLFQDENLNKINVPFGKTQSPELWDYADGVDTMAFLTGIK